MMSYRLQVQGLCNIEFRTFPFHKFPNHVKGNLKNYAWKFIIIHVSQSIKVLLELNKNKKLSIELLNMFHYLESERKRIFSVVPLTYMNYLKQ